jgi:hypothetical protein
MSVSLTQAFEVVEAALLQAPEERAGYPDAARLEPWLRNYVESLLLSHPEARQFLEEPALATCAGVLTADNEEVVPHLPGLRKRTEFSPLP